MASDILKENEAALKKIAESAPHYEDDSPEMTEFDSGGDIDRMLATTAQRLLDKAKGNIDKS